MALPTLICLQSVSNDKYLRYRYEDVQTHGLLQFAADTVMDPYAQFRVENSQYYGGLVHLKSCYNDKYWVRWSPNHYWITASANEPDENQTSWTCTLFAPVVVEQDGDSTKIRLRHVQLGHYVCLWRIDPPFDSCLFAGSSEADQDSCDIFAVANWASVFKLPSRVALKGDNGLYLGAQPFNGQNALQFAYGNPNDPQVVQEIYSSQDGTVFIRSVYYGMYWRVGDGNWIVADASDPMGSNDASAMFRASVVDINVVALMNMSPTWFCARLNSYSYGGNFLCANATSIDQSSRLEVTNLDYSRM